MALRRILVPVDFSEPSRRALDFAIPLATSFRAEITLLHVIDPVEIVGTPEALGLLAGPYLDLLVRREDEGRKELERWVKRLRGRRIGAHAVVVKGKPHKAIVETAERLRIDLIVMATHGLTGWSRLVLGSVAEKVVRLASCPVTTVGVRERKPRPRRAGAKGKP